MSTIITLMCLMLLLIIKEKTYDHGLMKTSLDF
ncbi:hypothetical protein LINPERPRIM_LOCUS40693 [Linum perenne]